VVDHVLDHLPDGRRAGVPRQQLVFQHAPYAGVAEPVDVGAHLLFVLDPRGQLLRAAVGFELNPG